MKFFTYSWQLAPGTRDEHLIAWALDENGNDSCIHFPGYRDTVVVGLPPMVGGVKIDWNPDMRQHVINEIRSVLGGHEGPINPPAIVKDACGNDVFFQHIRGQYMMYYQSDLKSFIKFRITSSKQRQEIKKALCNKGISISKRDANGKVIGNMLIKLVIYDDDFGMDLKFIVDQEIDYSNWMECDVKLENNGYTKVNNYVAKYWTVKKATGVGMGKPVVLAYDIECNSKKLIVPDKNKIEDYIGMISLVYAKAGDKEMTKELITIFKPNPIEGVIVHVCKSERELLNKFRERIKEISPVWICGYNIDGFDTPYMRQRFAMYSIPFDFSKVENHVFEPRFIKGSMNGRFRDGFVFGAPGIISKDLCKAANAKLRIRSYALDKVAVEMFGKSEEENKMDIGGHKQIFLAMQNYDPNDKKSVEHATTIGIYCVRDSEVCIRLFNRFGVHVDDAAMSNASIVTMDVLNTRGQMIRTLAQMYRIAKRSKPQIFLVQRGKCSESFVGGNVSTPIAGFHKDVATLDFNSLYPSIIIAYNIDYHTLINPELYHDMDNDPKLKELWGEPYDKDTNPNGKWHKILCPEGDTVYEYRYVTKGFAGDTGLLPRNAANLLAARKIAKGEMGKCEYGSVDYKLADCKQNALKIVNNSAYGFLMAPGNWASIECGRSVTGKGRESKLLVEVIIKEKYGGIIIYGDTDSVMYQIPGCKTTEEAYAFSMMLEKDISAMMIKGLTLEMEKLGYFFSLKAKHYIYWPYDIDNHRFKLKKDNFTPDYLIRGVVSTKRDRAKSHIKIFEHIYDTIMRSGLVKNADQLLSYLWQATLDIYFGARGIVDIDKRGLPVQRKKIAYKRGDDGQYVKVDGKKIADGFSEDSVLVKDADGVPLVVCPYDWSDMEMTFKMGDNYDNENFHLNVLSERLRAEGKPIEVGMRFGALLKKSSTGGNLGSRTITTDEYEDYIRDLLDYNNGRTTKEPERIEIDRLYYLEKKMADTTDTLLAVRYKDEILMSSDRVHKKIIINIFQKLYMMHGHELITTIAGRPDPIVAVYTGPNAQMAEDLKQMYTKQISNRKTINYSISANVMGNCIKHLVKRNHVLSQLLISPLLNLIMSRW